MEARQNCGMTLATQLKLSIVPGSGIVVGCIRRRWPRDVRIRHAQARRKERLDDHLDLLRYDYNFVRPHGALRFGREVRTPAKQAGLTNRALTFREIF